MPQTRVLLVSAAIGGGHDAVSRALAERLEEQGAVVAIDDFYDAEIPRLSKVVSWLNRAWLLHFGRLYQWVWDHLVRRGPFATLATGFFRLTGAVAVRRLVKRHRPDVVVATYPMCVPALARRRRRGRLAAPVISYPNDFGAHVLWVEDGVDLYLAPTEEAARWLEAYGVSAPVHRVGIPVRAAFAGPLDKAGARAALGFDGTRPAVLATAGGDGVGHLDELVATLAPLDVDIAVICGRNRGLRERVEALGTRALVVGFVEDMERWLAAADLLVGTPGPISASEAFCAGTPVVSYRPYTGHGIDNASWVARAGAGWVTQSPGELRALVERLLAAPAELAGAEQAAAALAEPEAALEAARQILATAGVEPGAYGGQAILGGAPLEPGPGARPEAGRGSRAGSPTPRAFRRWPRRAAAFTAALVALAVAGVEAPAVAAGSLHMGVVRHLRRPGGQVGILVQAPPGVSSVDAVADVASIGGVTLTYLTGCGTPDPAALSRLAERQVDVGVLGDGRLLSSPGSVHDTLRRCRLAIEHAGASASAFLPTGERYSWGAYVGSRGWTRMSPAQVVDLRSIDKGLPASISSGDVVLFVLSEDTRSRDAFARDLADMGRRGLVPVSVTELLSGSG